jgi:hypothetical protein
MALGPSPAGSGGPIPPTHRPPWFLILSSITLIYGGLLLVSGLLVLRNPASAAKYPMARPMAPDEEAIAKELATFNTEFVTRHAGVIRGRAVASSLLALLMLYAAAAALARDRNGRTATLVAAWFGIVYQVASLPFMIPIAEDYAAASAPILARMVASDLPPAPPPAGDAGSAAAATGADAAGTATAATPTTPGTTSATTPPAASPAGEPLRPEAIAGMVHTFAVGVPIATALLGIMGSLLLITYFGGRRGRALYGLTPTRRPPPRA